MTSQRTQQVLASLAGALGAVWLVTAACSKSDDTPPATETDTGTPDAAEVATTPDADAAVEADVGPKLTKPPGCFPGKPTTHLELINACTESTYVIFDNCARIGYCDGGTLPDRVDPDTGSAESGAGDSATDGAGGG